MMSLYTTGLKDLICNAVQRKSDETNIIKAVIVKLAFQFKFTRGNNKNHKFGVKIWVFSAACFYGETTEISFSALLQYKHFGQHSHDIFPLLDQYLHMTFSIINC